MLFDNGYVVPYLSNFWNFPSPCQLMIFQRNLYTFILTLYFLGLVKKHWKVPNEHHIKVMLSDYLKKTRKPLKKDKEIESENQ